MASQNKPPRGAGAPSAPAVNRTAGATGKAASGASAPRTPQQPRRAERRPEMIKQRREQRRQVYERQQRQWLLTRIGLIAFAVVAVAGIGFLAYQVIRSQRLNVVPEGTVDYAYAGGDHEAGPVAYAEVPPVGGAHDAVWQNCGYYDAPIRSENAVHSLEHGAVWITYQPDLPAEQVEVLREKAGQSYVLVSPFLDLPAPVVASSWNHQLHLDSADDERLDQFIRRFKQGPDTPEPGATCFGGVGTPL